MQAKVSASAHGNSTLSIAEQLTDKADVIRAMHERAQTCQDPQTEVALLRESPEASRINHIPRVHGLDILQERRAADVYDEAGRRSLERLLPGLTDDSITQATLRAGQLGIGIKRAHDIAAPAHLAALIAAKPRILAMIQDGVTAGLLPKYPLEERLNAMIATPTSTYLAALDETDEATAKLFIQKAIQAADEARQHAVQRQQGGVPSPTIAAIERPSSASQEEDSDDMGFSAPRKSRINTPKHVALWKQQGVTMLAFRLWFAV